MKKALIALAVLAFAATGAAQPEIELEQEDLREPEDLNITDNTTVEEAVNETEEALEREAEEQIETGEERSSDTAERFNAQLDIAVRTVDTLVAVAPNDEARDDLQSILSDLREVRDTNYTAESEENREQIREEAENRTEQEAEELGQETGEAAEEAPGAGGASRNENRPGFVNQMIGGLFG